MTATPTESVISPTATLQLVATDQEMEQDSSPHLSSAGIWVGVIIALALAAGGIGTWVTTNRIPK